MAVSHAVLTPIRAIPVPTPKHSKAEFRMYSGNTVCERWDQVALVPPTKRLRPTLATGSAASTATAMQTSNRGERVCARMM